VSMEFIAQRSAEDTAAKLPHEQLL
jgi:hypothetical protein